MAGAARHEALGLLLVLVGGSFFAVQNLCVVQGIEHGAHPLEMTTARGVIMLLCAIPCAVYANYSAASRTRWPFTSARTASCLVVTGWLGLRAGFGWISIALQQYASPPP